MVTLNEILPRAVAEVGLLRRRVDDIGEQDGREDGVEFGPRWFDAEERTEDV
jgi:hypothetical protein